MTTAIRRPFAGESDLPAFVDLLVASCGSEEAADISLDDIRGEWIAAEPGWSRRLTVWATEEQLVAAIGIWHEVGDPEGRTYAEIEIHPAWRTPELCAETLTEIAGASAALVGAPSKVRITVPATWIWKREVLASGGYVLDRVYHRMQLQPSAAPASIVPVGYLVRPIAGEDEAAIWTDAHNAGFAGHDDFAELSLAEKLHRMREPHYVQSIDLIALTVDGSAVGVAWCSIDNLDDGRQEGWIKRLAVRPGFRGEGLGRALLAASIDALRAAGQREIYLSVDSGNETGALALYESAGFEVIHEMLVMRLDIA